MSQRFRASRNVNASKNTRLAIAEEFAHYRFGRDQLAHVSRYLYIVEWLEGYARKLGRPLDILDIGCGDVYVARVLIASSRVKKTDVVRRYVGLDIDDYSLQLTGKTLPQSMPIELICGDVTTGGLAQFTDKAFDLVICTEVLEHIQPEFVLGVLSEIKRLTQWALISTPNVSGGSGRIPQDHVQEWDCEVLTALMRQAGLEVRKRIGIFCNLARVKELCKQDPKLAKIYDLLSDRMDSHFLSICMARFVGAEAQNVLYICEC